MRDAFIIGGKRPKGLLKHSSCCRLLLKFDFPNSRHLLCSIRPLQSPYNAVPDFNFAKVCRRHPLISTTSFLLTYLGDKKQHEEAHLFLADIGVTYAMKCVDKARRLPPTVLGRNDSLVCCGPGHFSLPQRVEHVSISRMLSVSPF